MSLGCLEMCLQSGQSGANCASSCSLSNSPAGNDLFSCGGSACLNVCTSTTNPGCRAVGDTCFAYSDCCSQVCSNGQCIPPRPPPPVCLNNGFTCQADAQCCAGSSCCNGICTGGACIVPPPPVMCVPPGFPCGPGAPPLPPGAVCCSGCSNGVCGGAPRHVRSPFRQLRRVPCRQLLRAAERVPE